MGLGWLAAALTALLSAPLDAPFTPTLSAPWHAHQSAPHGSAGCVGIPRSLDGRTVADAIAATPSLSAFAGAIGAAGLVNELNKRPQITVFAPANEALAKQAGEVTLDPATLRYHVVPARLAPERLVGTHRTLHGELLSVVRSATHVQVNAAAGVICTRVRAANGYVYLIDAVLTPR